MSIKTLHEETAVALRFRDEEAFDEALWFLTEAAPDHEIFFAEDYTIIIDGTDKKFVESLHKKYTEEEVAHSTELSQEELSTLRYKNLFRKK